MPAAVELKYWKKGTVEKQPIARLLADEYELERKIRHKKRNGHLAVGIKGMQPSYYYWSYTGETDGCCAILKSAPLNIVEDPYSDETEVMSLYNPDDPDNRIRNPADETLHLPTLNARKTAAWGKKFKKDNKNTGTYILCNIRLLCRRFWCISPSDSPDNDSELKYIMESGRANCSVFAYALLRAGGLPPPDGIPNRHLIFSFLIGLFGLIQVIMVASSGVLDRSHLTTTDVSLVIKAFCLLGFPILTVTAAIIAATINCYHGVSVRTPAGVYKLAKLHSEGKTLNYIRRCVGPNNIVTWVIYSFLTLGAIADTIGIPTSMYGTDDSAISITGGCIGGLLFICAVLMDFSFESNTSELKIRESVKRAVCEKSRVAINVIRSSRIVSFFYDNPTVAPDNTSDTEETTEPNYHTMEEGTEHKEEHALPTS